MNEYGAMAQRQWQQYLPRRYASIDDPDAYFTGLGEQVAAEIAELLARMHAQAGNPSGEDYAAQVGRLNAMRKQAEEVVPAELVLLPPEPGTGEDDPAAEEYRCRADPVPAADEAGALTRCAA